MLALLRSSILTVALAPPLPAPPVSYDAALAELESASKQANRGVSPVVMQRLAQALDAVEGFPTDLADDAEGHVQYELALLNYARLQLSKGDRVAAEQAMDRAIFAAGERTLEADRFGPDIAALHQERVADIAGRGSAELEVTCHVLCKVYVDSNELEWTTAELPLGPHRVRVISVELDPLVTQLDLDKRGAQLEYGEPLAPVVVGEDDYGKERKPRPKRERALMWGQVERPIPLWKSIGFGVSAGTFVVSTGVGVALLLQAGAPSTREITIAAENSLLDDKDTNDIDPNDTVDEMCAQAQENIDPEQPGQVANASVTQACFTRDNRLRYGQASLIVAGVTGASTIVFGLLLNTYRPGKARAGRRQLHPSFAVTPRLEGGVMVVGGMRF